MARLDIGGFDEVYDEISRTADELEFDTECPEYGKTITIRLNKKTKCPHCGSEFTIES